MSGEYIISYTDPAKGTFTINSLETEGPGSLNTIPIVTANGGVGGNFALSGDFTARFTPGFTFSVVGSLVAPPNNGGYVVASSVFQGTNAINTISAVQKKFVLNGANFTAVFTPGRIFKISNSQTPVSNNGYWIVASSAFVAGNTEIIVATGVPSGYRDGNTIDGSGTAATPIVSAVAAPTNTFTVTGNQTAYFTPAFGFTVTGTPSNNGAYTVLSSTFNVIQNQTIITVTTPVAANQGAVGTISFALVTGSITTNLTVVLPTVAVPTSVNFPDGDVTYTLTGSTSLTLPGRGVVNYGLNIIEDLVYMLENFYNPTPPVNPTKGQLWFDSVGNTLKVFNNGSVFTPITGGGGSAALSSITPAISPNTIDNVDFQQTWTWELTTDPDFGLAFDEAAPSTGGVGSQALLVSNVQTGSSASPLTLWRGGVGTGVQIFASYPAIPGADGADTFINGTTAEGVTGNGGTIGIFAGSNFPTTGTGNAGSVQISTGYAIGAGDVNGGNMLLQTGGGTGTAAGGIISLFAGPGGSSPGGDGGTIQLVGGVAGNSSGSGFGGPILLTGGFGRGAQLAGGYIAITGGQGTANADAGDVGIFGGLPQNAGGGGIEIIGSNVLSVSAASITNVSTGSQGTFTVLGNKTAKFYPTYVFTVSGSTGNDGSYTVLSSTFLGGNTIITVTGSISDPTPDGTITGFLGGAVTLISGNNTTTGDAPPVNIFGGNAVNAVAHKGGNVNITAGNSTGTAGASAGGDVVITAGQNAFNSDQGFFTIITGTPPTNRLTINGSGTWFLNGSAGSPGYVLTSNGLGLPPTWNPAGGGSVALSSITAAVAGNTILNSNFEQSWRWNLTGPSDIGFFVTESAPSTGGAGGQHLFILSTQSGSTADVLQVQGGDANFSINRFGAIVMSAGASFPADIGSNVNISGGSPNASAVTNAGNVSISGGFQTINGANGGSLVLGGGQGSTDGGNVTLSSGSGTTNGNGGFLSMSAGTAAGTGTGGDTTIIAGNSPTGTPGNFNITAGSTGGSNNGGDVNVTAGNAGNFNNGGGINITSGTSASGNAGTVIVAGATGPTTGAGGSVQVKGGNGGTTGGGVSIASGSATTNGNGANVDISAGNSIGGNTGGQITLTSGTGVGTNASGGVISVSGGNGTGTGSGSSIVFRVGVSSATGTDGTFFVGTFGGYMQQQGYNFATDNDSRSCQYLVQNQTTDATITELFVDGTFGNNRRMTLVDNSTWNFEIKVVARRTDAANESFSANFEGSIDRQTGAASTALVTGVLSTPLADDSGGSWLVTVDADTTNGALRVQVTGQVGKTIRWMAFVRTVEVTN